MTPLTSTQTKKQKYLVSSVWFWFILILSHGYIFFFSYMKQVNKFHLTEKRVAKVVPNRSFSVAFHPTTERVLVATGDKWGKLGLWDVVS